MLKITGKHDRFCDHLSRRRFMQIGSLGVAGLSLPALLRAEAEGQRPKGRSIILIWQHGGPSQLDTFDMKPDAPSEVRGPYQSIGSKLAGVPVGELLPYQAKILDKCTIIRSFTHGNGDHWAAAHWMLTGYLGATGSDRVPRNPSMGAISSYLLGSKSPGVPATVNMNDGGFGFHGAAYLGVSYNPFRTGNFSYGNEAGRLPAASDGSFKLVDGMHEDRLMNRVSLLKQFDKLKRTTDTSNTFANMDRMNQRAAQILLSGDARRAFDLSREDPKTRERYGPGWGEQALLARRLVEAGVRFVSLNTGYWDDHGNIKGALDSKMPRHDRAVGVLIQDLADRGMLDDTLVVTAGEFGRTPKINKNAGRDHWPQAQSLLFAGGGYQHGQVIGATNSKAEHPISDPIGPNDFSAILYQALNLKPNDSVNNLSGRPVHLLPGGTVPSAML